MWLFLTFFLAKCKNGRIWPGLLLVFDLCIQDVTCMKNPECNVTSLGIEHACVLCLVDTQYSSYGSVLPR